MYRASPRLVWRVVGVLVAWPWLLVRLVVRWPLRWVWGHPYRAVWLLAALVLVVEKGL
ncbi:MAG: hypothetical protein ACRD2C_08755 [Acidimicrobiales bacterium]